MTDRVRSAVDDNFSLLASHLGRTSLTQSHGVCAAFVSRSGLRAMSKKVIRADAATKPSRRWSGLHEAIAEKDDGTERKRRATLNRHKGVPSTDASVPPPPLPPRGAAGASTESGTLFAARLLCCPEEEEEPKTTRGKSFAQSSSFISGLFWSGGAAPTQPTGGGGGGGGGPPPGPASSRKLPMRSPPPGRASSRKLPMRSSSLCQRLSIRRRSFAVYSHVILWQEGAGGRGRRQWGRATGWCRVRPQIEGGTGSFPRIPAGCSSTAIRPEVSRGRHRCGRLTLDRLWRRARDSPCLSNPPSLAHRPPRSYPTRLSRRPARSRRVAVSTERREMEFRRRRRRATGADADGMGTFVEQRRAAAAIPKSLVQGANEAASDTSC